MLDHLFEPFFTTKALGQGTGLGLATVYGIVKQNDGFINVYSEPGQGTTFSIYLPPVRGPDDPAAAAHAGQAVRGQGDGADCRGRGRPAEGDRHGGGSSLGYEVLTATSPAEALRVAGSHPEGIDALLTDVVMPGMNGRDLADRVRAMRPGIACLYMSGYTADVIAHRGVLDEGVLFIQKPFSTADLSVKLREALTPA